MGIERVQLCVAMTDEWVGAATGTLLDDRHYDRGKVYRRAVDVIKPDGSLLLALRPGLPWSVPWVACTGAWDDLRRCARESTHRVTAAGGAPKLHSGTLGYIHGRLTSATPTGEGWRRVTDLLRWLDHTFSQEAPARHAVLVAAAARARGVIDGTAFTTATVNRWGPRRNARMAVHPDRGNLPGGYAAMTVIKAGDYGGGLLVFPRYRVAVDLRSADVLVCDNQEPHGNTAVIGSRFERVSVVAYFHASNL